MELFNQNVSSSYVAGIPYQPLYAFLSAKKKGRNPPPYIPTWEPMPLHQLCQLALLWHENGFQKEAGELVYSLLQLQDWPSLWCPENEFDEFKIKEFFSKIAFIEPFLSEKKIPVTLFSGKTVSGALTTVGNGTSLGVLRSKDVEIRAFGPQTFPLNESNRFGIKGMGTEGWVRCFALPEVWLEMRKDWREEECRLNIRFVGLKPEEPIAFVFYVKARECQVEQEIFRPKSLRYFQGNAQTIILNHHFTIESSLPHKVQVIPLAGVGCFWNCEFLISFEINSFSQQIAYTIKW